MHYKDLKSEVKSLGNPSLLFIDDNEHVKFMAELECSGLFFTVYKTKVFAKSSMTAVLVPAKIGEGAEQIFHLDEKSLSKMLGHDVWTK